MRPAQDEGTAYSSRIRAGNCWLISGHNQGLQSLGLAVTTSVQEANTEVVDGSAYRIPVSLKVSIKYIELNLFLKKIGQLQAVCSVTGTNCCDDNGSDFLCTFQRMLPARAPQSSLDAYFKSAIPDSDSCVSAALHCCRW
jgi:hypothetical protein